MNYKTPKLLDACIASVYKFTKGCDFEILVVDNHSEDESEFLIKKNYPTVQWLEMGYNAGFGRANNYGIEHAKGDYTLLLNSDTELFEDAISKTLDHYKELERIHQKVGLVGCQIKHQDGRLQPSCNYYWAGLREVIEEHPIGIKILQHWLKIPKLRSINKYDKLNTNHEITWLGVPFALIRSSVIKNDKFDPQFFMYSEDEELNYRLSKKGFKHFFFAETGVYHHIGASSNGNVKRDKQILISKFLFIYKSYSNLYLRFYNFIYNSTIYWNNKLHGKNTSTEKEYNFKMLVCRFRKEKLINEYNH